MRVIAGSRRSIPLQTLEGKDVRPTTDRIKETLFNMLAASIPGARVLDLFAGSGQIGIEALSRGAEYAVFIDHSRKACHCIASNLKKTRFEEQAKVVCRAVSAESFGLPGEEPFDLIFMDPPYALGDQDVLLGQIAKQGILAEHGILVIEADRSTVFDKTKTEPLQCFREKVYKTNQHLFFSYGEEG